MWNEEEHYKNNKDLIDKWIKYENYIIERNKKYDEKNKPISIKKKEYNLKNKDKIKIQREKYYQKNKDKILERNKKYNLKNKDKYNEYLKKYHKNKRKNDLSFKFSVLLRNKIKNRIKQNNGIKQNNTIKLLGCSIEYFKQYIESQFDDEMSWSNYGFYGWHLDHKIPCTKFDLTKEEEQLKCFHYTNYQPLWMKDNLSKGKKTYT